LADGPLAGAVEELVDDLACLVPVEVAGFPTQGPGSVQVDASRPQGVPHPGQLGEGIRQRQLVVRLTGSQSQGGGDLIGGELVDVVESVGGGVLIPGRSEGQFPHIGVQLGLEVGDLADASLEECDQLVAVQESAVNTFQPVGQLFARLQIGQPFGEHPP